jgi:hypothetical protein
MEADAPAKRPKGGGGGWSESHHGATQRDASKTSEASGAKRLAQIYGCIQLIHIYNTTK